MPDKIYSTSVENDEFFKFVQLESLVHFSGMVVPLRPGGHDCITFLEFNHYQHGSPENDQFHLPVIRWLNINWGCVSIPKNDMPLMEEISDDCGLQCVPATIVSYSVKKLSYFP